VRCTYLSTPLTVARDYRVFEVEFLGKWVCVAAFNLYCSGVIEEKMKCAGYWRPLQILEKMEIKN